jgi:penicillin-binding protein 2
MNFHGKIRLEGLTEEAANADNKLSGGSGRKADRQAGDISAKGRRMRFQSGFHRVLLYSFILLLASSTAFGAHKRRHRPVHHARTVKRVRHYRHRSVIHHASYVVPGVIIRGGPWTEPTYADSTAGDNADGEDLEVRRAAVQALGPYNGSIVVVDSNTGRILSIVNQKLALSSGFQPCSTIKISVALAALSEKLITGDGFVRLWHRGGFDLTQALAHSNNYYFATLGTKLGFDKVSYYAHLFGYGETAGLDIPGESPGRFPTAPPANGGVGMLTSFGEGISQTPLQLAALITALANGGTLYYLQYPRTQQDIARFVPRVKRKLEIAGLIPEVKQGMLAAVEYGTARRAQQSGTVAGKTGTCTDSHTHLGWFGSFNDVGRNKLVVVVLLTGGRPAIGPRAAEVAGEVYRNLSQENYFATTEPITPAALVSTQICCSN